MPEQPQSLADQRAPKTLALALRMRRDQIELRQRFEAFDSIRKLRPGASNQPKNLKRDCWILEEGEKDGECDRPSRRFELTSESRAVQREYNECINPPLIFGNQCESVPRAEHTREEYVSKKSGAQPRQKVPWQGSFMDLG